MTQKQSLLNIVIGSLVIGIAGTYIQSVGHGLLGAFEFAAGLSIVAFVVLLFLTSFLPARAARKLANAGERGTGRQRPQRNERTAQVENRREGQGEKRGMRSRANFRERRRHKREQRYAHPVGTEQPPAPGNELRQSRESQPPEDIGNTNLLRGSIKWYNKRKGFGFIQFEDQEIFFHRNEIESPAFKLNDLAPVEFLMGSNAKGPQATRVRVIE